MRSPVEITKKAIAEIRHILQKKNIPAGYGLRMSIKGGRGCAGINYALGFDKPRENDETFQIDGIEIHIRKSEMMFLIGKKVDFYEGPDARGFMFTDTGKDHEDISTVAR